MMRNILLSAGLILISIGVIAAIPFTAKVSEEKLASPQIPANNSEVSGVQKYVVPPQDQGIPPPILSSRSSIVLDLDTDAILYQKNADLRVPIASTTKIMTALVAIEYFKPNSELIVGEGSKVDGARVGLFWGEKLSFRSLLYGMLLSSGNDAAYTIADNYPGGINSFVLAMNQKAKDLNLLNTNFENPAGFDSLNHYSTASDLAKITQASLKDSQLGRVFATKDTTVTSLDGKYKHKLTNLNKLLSSVAGVLGVKTGYTNAAKENLVGLVDRNEHKVLTVVLGSDDRFGETSTLIEWVYGNFIWPD